MGWFHGLLFVVAFIAQYVDFNILSAVGSDFVKPEIFNLIEAFVIINIVDYDDDICIVVVGFGNAFESFLTCGVPDL